MSGSSAAPGAGWWIREAALDRLDRDPAPRVVTVVAPAGSGKVRLVQRWAARHPERPVRWFDAARHGAAELLAAAPRPPADDYAVLVVTAAEHLHPDDVAELVERVPPGIRLVLTGVGDPLPAEVQVDLAGEAERFGPADLWWPAPQVAACLTRATGVPASPAATADLMRLTDGWPAGVLILAGLTGSRARVLTADRALPQPEILDFVATSVLGDLPPWLRDFVETTAPLDVLDPAVCAALAPELNAHAMLVDARRFGLLSDREPFTVRPRWRTLVRLAALREVRRRDPEAERRVLRTAAGHALGFGRGQDAFAWSVRGADWPTAFAVLQEATADGLRGWNLARLRTDLAGLPPGEWTADPQRRPLVARATALAGDTWAALELRHRTPPAADDPARWRPVEILAGAARGPVAGADDDEAAAAHLLSARAAQVDDDREVTRHLDAGWAVAGARPPQYAVLAGLGAEALVAARTGELNRAQRVAARAHQVAAAAGLLEHPTAAAVALARATLLQARGRTGEALAELDAAAGVLAAGQVVEGRGGRPVASAGHLLRAALLLDRNDPAAADAAAAAAQEADDALPPVLAAARRVVRARLDLARDDVVAAEHGLADEVGGAAAALRVTAALLRSAPEVAQRVLQGWPASRTRIDGVQRLLARAAVACALDRRTEAGDCVQAALAAAEPDGHVQVFLDARPALWPIAVAVLRRPGATSPWAAELARRLDLARSGAEPADTPVTRRERVVLEHLARPLTHAQIAAALFVSENTLKSHCRNLYRKLGVNSRADALAVARARGWLPPEPQGDVVLNLDVTPAAADVEL